MAEGQGSWDPQVDMQRYYEAAAVLDAFDPFTWQPTLGPRPDGSLPGPLTSSDREELLQKLLIDCEQILEGPLHGLWRLTHSARRAQLRRLGNREAMRAMLAMTQERPSSPAQHAFEQLLSGEPPGIEEMARDDLAAMITVRGWLDGILEDLPARGTLSAALARADLLAPMRRLLRNGFVNREQELAQLREYVDGDAQDGREAPLFIYGSGGVGKSTLLAQFILTLAQDSERSFAYVDIDRPTIRPQEPLTILLEVITQLQAQYHFDEIARNDLVNSIVDEMGRVEEGHTKESLSSGSGYEFYVNKLGETVRRALSDQQVEYAPPVIVVDTFEEAQWFGHGTVEGLLDLLFALHNSGQFRVVISGRVLPDEFLSDAFYGRVTLPVADPELLQEELAAIPLPERPLNVNVLDEEASRELLAVAVAQASLPPLTVEEQTDIIGIVTRNPMCLKLAVRLLQNEGIEKLRETRRLFLAQLKAEKIQALLYGRILSHIKKHDVRQVAYPGLVVRRITPDVIREVLAGPCKLKLTAERNEDNIFEDMRREAALVVFDSADKSLRHRPDVRRAMLLDLTDHVDEETVAAIDLAAVTYYARFDDPASRAEEIYHRLRRHEPGDDLDARWLPEAARYLKDAGAELPATQRLWLARWLNITLDDDVRQEADQEAWEDQAARSAGRYLASADAWTALKILEEREERLPRSRLYDLQAEAYRILGAHDQALAVGREGVDALIAAGDLGQALDLLLKMVVVEESRAHLAEADSLLYEAENVARQNSDRVKALRAEIARLRIERKIRPDSEARQIDLRRAALAGMDDEMRLALRSHPVLLRESAAELALYDPELAAVAIDRLGLETTRAQERTQGRMLGHVLDVLYRQTASAGESGADDDAAAEGAAFVEQWRSSDHDPIVVEKWVSARGRDLVDRLAQRARRSEPGSDLLRALQDYFRAGESIVLEDVGKTYQKGGRSADAQKIYLQTLETMRRAGDRDGEARTLSNLAEIARIESRPDEALSLLEQALAIWRGVGDRAEEARTLYDYAALLLVLRRHDEAGEPFREALAIFRQLGDEERVAMTLRNLAVLHSELGDLDKALAYFEEVVAIYRQLGDRRQEAAALVIMAGTLSNTSRLAEAREALEAALAIWRAIGDRSEQAETLVELAAAAEAEGHPDAALSYYENSLQIMRELGSGDREQWVLKEMDRLKQQSGGDVISAGNLDSGEGVAIGQGSSTQDMQFIFQKLVELFNLEELRELCFILGVEFDLLAGSSTAAKARQLVEYMRRRDSLEQLKKAMKELRPELEW
ncbi:MAG: tetratricopeptide repeat protein [Candidatus Promineifilaceae bacterium]